MTKAKFKQILQAYIEREETYILEHEMVLNVLRSVDGKPFSGTTFSKRRLGDILTFSSQYGMFYLTGKQQHLIGYKTDRGVSSERFKAYDSCHGPAARERIALIKAIDTEKAYKLFNQIEKHFDGLRTLFGELERSDLGSFYFPAYYDVLNSIFTPESNSDPKLTDFYYIRK